MRRPALLLLLAAALLAGCGGGAKSNGEADKTADQIVADALAAVRTASSVHVSGGGLSSGQPLQVDLTLVAGKGGKGRITSNGITFDMIRIGSTAYFKAGPRFWRGFGGAAAATLLQNRWLKASATTGKLSSFTPLTNVTALFRAILTSHGALAKTGESTVDGIRVVGIRDAGQGGTLYVATTGKPYPVALRKSGRNGGVLTFDGWDAAATIAAPPNPVDLSKLGGLG